VKKPRFFCCLAAVLAMALPVAASKAAAGLAALFPDLDGWTRDGAVAAFQPDNLYEHINGAAENFLAYGFQRLAVQNYTDKQKRSLSAEIYFHGSPENAFGIYGSEKPLAGDYLAIGGQGYYEEGVLNFFSGAYYVKLNGFDLGADGRATLQGLAERIAAAIPGTSRLPETLSAFPAPGRVAHSERYIASNFLGHDFLLPAFTADYVLDGEKFQLFIMKADSEETARAALQRYAALDKGLPGEKIQPGSMTINDPYNGPIQLWWRGAYIWGLNGQTSAAAKSLEALGRNLL